MVWEGKQFLICISKEKKNKYQFTRCYVVLCTFTSKFVSTYVLIGGMHVISLEF